MLVTSANLKTVSGVGVFWSILYVLTLTLVLHAWAEQPVLANAALQNQTKAILWFLQEDASTYGQRKHGYFVSGFLV